MDAIDPRAEDHLWVHAWECGFARIYREQVNGERFLYAILPEEIDVPTDNAVLQMFNNYVKPKCQAARVDSKKRVCLVSKIFDKGFFYNSQWDNEIR